MMGKIENVGDNSGIVSAIGLHSGACTVYDSGMATDDLHDSFSLLTSDFETPEL